VPADVPEALDFCLIRGDVAVAHGSSLRSRGKDVLGGAQ
jgi:hypothetical protein